MSAHASGELPAFVRHGATFSDHLPLIVFPQGSARLCDASARALRACVDRYLSRAGCILFRDFEIDGPEHFAQWVDALGFGRTTDGAEQERARGPGGIARRLLGRPERHFGLEPRQLVGSPERPILWLHCARPRYLLEEALIADNRELYRRLSLAVRTRFLSRGLLYERTLPGAGQGGWQEHFRTTDRAAVEAWCRAQGITVTWGPQHDLVLSRRECAVAVHGPTGQSLWQNRLLSCFRGSAFRPAHERDRYGLEVRYGDGSQIAGVDIENVRAAFEASASVVPLERGDVLMLDPELVWQAQVPNLFDLVHG